MNIGFDAKRVFHNRTGLGNYSRHVVGLLSAFYPKNSYFLYNTKLAKSDLYICKSQNVVEKFPRSLFNKTFKGLWRQFTMVKALKEDGIFLFHGLSGEIPFGLDKTKISSVVTIHDLIFMRYPSYFGYWDRKIYLRKFKYAAKHADLVIAVSEQTKLDVQRFLEVEASKVKVVYQGCQPIFKKSYLACEIEEMLVKYKLPRKFILNVGTVESRKNVLTLIKAVQEIKDNDASLVIIGSTKSTYAKMVRTYVSRNNLDSKVYFLSSLSDKELAIIYQSATLFVYPSVFEGFGIPIIEALYSKTPVITTKEGCFQEAGGPNSIYLNDPEDHIELAKKIKKLLANESERKRIAEKGYQFVQKFNDDKIAQNLFAAYEEAINIKNKTCAQ